MVILVESYVFELVYSSSTTFFADKTRWICAKVKVFALFVGPVSAHGALDKWLVVFHIFPTETSDLLFCTKWTNVRFVFAGSCDIDAHAMEPEIAFVTFHHSIAGMSLSTDAPQTVLAVLRVSEIARRGSDEVIRI